MKTEEQIKQRIEEEKKNLIKYKELLQREPSNKDFAYDVDYIRHYIKHLEWVFE